METNGKDLRYTTRTSPSNAPVNRAAPTWLGDGLLLITVLALTVAIAVWMRPAKERDADATTAAVGAIDVTASALKDRPEPSPILTAERSGGGRLQP